MAFARIVSTSKIKIMIIVESTRSIFFFSTAPLARFFGQFLLCGKFIFGNFPTTTPPPQKNDLSLKQFVNSFGLGVTNLVSSIPDFFPIHTN